MEHPEPLVQSDGDGKLEISKRGKEIFSSLKCPVTVVAVAGLYRTGKSFLLNRLAGSQSGFPLGSTVQSKTKGIWFWVVPHPSSPGSRHLVLLDTEGLADPEKGDSTHDAWIFSLAVLLSSCLVYNSIGTIDERAIENLHFITELTERIRIKSGDQEETGDDFDSFFPSFFWVLRDFVLELRLNGKICTADDYLENSLKLKPGRSKGVQSYNFPRQVLKSFFRERKCFVLIRPVDDEERLRNMEELKESDLKPEFLEGADKFCQALFQSVPNKTIAGKQLNGSMLLAITESYINAINNGAVPCIGNAFKTMAEIENRKAIEESVGIYESLMKSDLLPKFPVGLDVFSQLHHQAEQKAVVSFLSMAVSDDHGKFQEEMQSNVEEKHKHFLKMNEDASTKKCREIIENLFKDVRDKVHSGFYAGGGGYDKYQQDRAIIQKRYEDVPDKGVSAASVLSAFNKEHEDEARAILAADAALTEKEKEVEEANREAEEKALIAKAAEEKAEELKQNMIDQQRSHMIHVQELDRKKAQDLELARQEYERKTEKVKKEQEELLRAGFNEQAQLMKDQLNDIKKQKEESEKAAAKQMETTRKTLEQQKELIEEMKRAPANSGGGGGKFQNLGKLIGKAIDHVVPLFTMYQAATSHSEDKDSTDPVEDEKSQSLESDQASAPKSDKVPTKSQSRNSPSDSILGQKTEDNIYPSASSTSQTPPKKRTTAEMFEELNKRFPKN